jgi:hypothetical protein
MEGGMDTKFADQILASKLTTVVYFAVLLVLVFLILWQMRSVNKKTEGLIGSGIEDQVFTSGATMRRLAQEFTGTNQGEYTIVHNDELKELIPGVIPSKKERLVNERGEPDFWEISSELNAYKESQVQPLAAEAAAQAGTGGAEWLAADSVASRVQDELLRETLYR